MSSLSLDQTRLKLLALLQEVRVIFLRNFSVMTSIGIHDFEKTALQRIVINVELYLTPVDVERDEIGEVLDYDFLRRGIGALAVSRHWNLQETLIDQIVKLCLEPAIVLGVRVSTAKPDVYADCEAVGLEIIRFKPFT
jgi:7,8-dihydroneopterin aldolase/epimerase/oxygenase